MCPTAHVNPPPISPETIHVDTTLTIEIESGSDNEDEPPAPPDRDTPALGPLRRYLMLGDEEAHVELTFILHQRGVGRDVEPIFLSLEEGGLRHDTDSDESDFHIQTVMDVVGAIPGPRTYIMTWVGGHLEEIRRNRPPNFGASHRGTLANVVNRRRADELRMATNQERDA
jgi:hypothetical protein